MNTKRWISRLAMSGAMMASVACTISCGSSGETSGPSRTGSASPTNAGAQTRQLGAPHTQQQAAAEPPAASRSSDPHLWRPAWWIDQPRHGDGRVAVSALADDYDLQAARRKALDSGYASLESEVGELPSDSRPILDVIQLPDGRFRAFVVVSASAS